jgi:hypothetical protein
LHAPLLGGLTAFIGAAGRCSSQISAEWLAAIRAKTAFIKAVSPRENGYRESFNLKLRDVLLNSVVSYGLAAAKVIIEASRRYYSTE